ncbi:MAG TPA: MIP/aquaporin family protein [Ktedonobacterales bacterium]|nr:MIP/aquaporin family protein [Ktedonobacterales bacterium]
MASEFTSRRGLGGELLAEFLGTMVLLLFGDGVVAVVLLFLGFSGADTGATSSWLLINWGWGFAVMLGVYVAGAISGAHLNPAVTLGFALRGITPWSKVGWYMLFQFLGAWFAALLLFIEYNTGFTSLEAKQGIVRGSPQSAGEASVFFTSPHTTLGGQVVPIWNALFDQILGTFLLVYLILAIVDARSSPPLSNLAPLIIGLLVVAIGMSFGTNAGYAINPARDFGPRVFAWMAGWGAVALPGDGPGYSAYFWVPIVGPLVGGAIAAYIYQFTLAPILESRFAKVTGAEEVGRTVREEREEEMPPRPTEA